MKDISAYISVLMWVVLFGLHAPDLSAKTVNQPDSCLRSVAAQVPPAGTPEYLQYLCARYEAAYQNDDMEAEIAALTAYQAEAARQKDYNEESYARGSRITCYFNYSEYDRMFAELPAELDFFARHGEWHRYYYFLSLKVEAYLITCRYQAAINEARAIYDQALKTNNRLGMGVASYCMGVTYAITQRNDQAETALRQAIGYLQGLENGYEMNFQCHLKLTDVLLSLDKHKELIHHAAQIEKLVDPKKTNYTVACFYTYNAYFWAHAGLGNLAAAERYYHQAHALIGTSYSMAYACLNMQAHLLTLQGCPQQALALVDSMMLYPEVRDSETMRNEKLCQKARLMDQLNRYADASRLKDEVLALQDSIYNRDFARQIDELQTIYDVDSLRFENERHRLWMVIATGGCLLLIILAAFAFYHNYRLRQKNHALYLQYQKQKQAEEVMDKVMEQSPAEEAPDKEMQLFLKIRKLLKDKELLVEPSLDRNLLAEKLSTNYTYISKAVQVGADMSVNRYISQARVDYACQLLRQKDRYTITEVQELCGFQSSTSFNRTFKEVMQMTPTNFQKESLGK